MDYDYDYEDATHYCNWVPGDTQSDWICSECGKREDEP